jgi:hypothetical protein
MKKLVFLLLAGLLLAPSEMFADKYNSKQVASASHVIRNPEQNLIDLYLDEDTGDLAITPNYGVTGLNITITGNGVTYLDTTVALTAGQSYTDSLAGYSIGAYILTLSTADGVVAQYEITVEPD